MSKYERLWNWIRENGTDSFKLTFDEIEKIAGIPIDHSFLNCKKELLNYGYKVGKIAESKCRCGYFKKGQEFIVEDLCPPLCHELWNIIYPSVYALQNGASLDYGDCRAKMFDAACPDEGRVCIHGEAVD